MLILVATVLLVWLLLQTETVQNIIVGKITKRLSKDLHTEVSIKHVSFGFFDKMNLEGTLVKDQKKDTLLYAGALKVRITDWFFWKDTADLKYVGLEDAVIKLQRKDSVWNYQFLIDHFASNDTATTTTKSLQLHLQKLDLKNVTFIKKDEWTGEDLYAKVGSMLMDAEHIDFNSSIIKINEIDLDKPMLRMLHYDGLEPDDTTKTTNEPDTGMYFNPGGLMVQVKQLKITNGTYADEKKNDELLEEGLFDGHHIIISKISGTISALSFINDTIKAQVDLAAKERSGLEIKKLKADFRLTPQIMEFAKMELRTPKSRIGDYYAMRYRDFNEDMNNYIEQVNMLARFKNAEVNSDDIAYFAPEMKNWKRQATISGKFTGTVDDYTVNNLFLRSGNDTYVTGDLRMKGLPDIDNTLITYTDGNLQTNYRDLASIIPDLNDIRTPNFGTLGTVHFQGNFTGSIRDFATTGNISTAIGGLYVNMKMKFPPRKEPVYDGTIITRQFNLGKFVEAPIIGSVSFNGKVAGSSFDIEKIITSLDGNFERFEFNNYAYQNLIVNGTLRNRFFTGEFKSNDTNFNFTSTIQIDLKQAKPSFNVLGDLVRADLQKLNMTNANFELTGLFDLNFEGRNIDEFTGSAKILNASLRHDSTQLSFDSLAVTSYVDSVNRKVLDVESNEFDVRIRGQYNILDLPNSFQAFLNNYFPAYINEPAIAPHDQRFLVTVHTRNFEKYAQIIDPKLSGITNATITGGVNTQDSGIFYLKTELPYLKYDRYSLQNAIIEGRGDYRSVTLDGNIEKIFVGDSTFFPNTTLNIRSENDHSDVHISTSANNTLNDAKLNADVYTLPDGVRIDFQPSSFVINEKRWDLERQGEIVVRKNFASAQNVKFTQGFQEITVETEVEDGSNVSDLAVKLKNVNLGDFTPIITKEPRMEGIGNGNIYLRDFYGEFKADGTLEAQQFRLNDDSVGLVKLKAFYDNHTKNLSYDVLSDNEKYNFSANGSYNFKDSAAVPLYSNIHLNEAKIGIVNQFLNGIFDNINGLAYGDLTIKGDPSSPDLLGAVSVKNAALTVNYTQVRYTIDSALFKFQDGYIDFGQFKIKDANKNTGTVRGRLYERGFKNMEYDFDLSTNKLILLNTTSKDNQQFYGKAIGKASLSFKGPEDDMHLTITGSVNDTTHIYIPTSNSRESSDADFIVFKQYGKEIEAPETGEESKLSIDLDLTANNQAQIDVILDELTGDVIKATGNGRVQIKVPATGDMTMKGRYNIEHGSYDFNFQSFIRKPFELLPNSGNFIEWTGDPYDANIHIDAQYTAERVSLNDLVGNQYISADAGTVRGYRGEVYVIAALRGKLEKPDINFRLDFPAGSPIKNNNDLALFMNRLQSDDNEMLKQVTYLIVFGSFAPYGELRTATNYTTLGLNTISQKLTAEINKLVSNLLYKITGDKSLQLDIGTSTYSSSSILGYGVGTNNNRLDRQTVNLKVNQSLLDGKIVVTFGGDLDFNLTNNSAIQNGNFQWLPDISVQIVLSPDRKLRAIVFNKSSLDVNTTAIGRRNRQGVSLSYTRDFEKLFGTKPRDTTRQITPQPPAITAD